MTMTVVMIIMNHCRAEFVLCAVAMLSTTHLCILPGTRNPAFRSGVGACRLPQPRGPGPRGSSSLANKETHPWSLREVGQRVH